MVYIRSSENDHRLKCLWTRSYRNVNELPCYSPGGCRGNVSCSSASRGCQLLLVEVCDQVRLRLEMMCDQRWLTLIWRPFSRWGRERVTSSLAYSGGQYPIYDYLPLIATQSTHNARLEIVDAPSTPFPGWGRECFSPFYEYKGVQYNQRRQWRTIITLLQLTRGYLTATIKWTTRIAEPAIGTDAI